MLIDKLLLLLSIARLLVSRLIHRIGPTLRLLMILSIILIILLIESLICRSSAEPILQLLLLVLLLLLVDGSRLLIVLIGRRSLIRLGRLGNGASRLEGATSKERTTWGCHGT